MYPLQAMELSTSPFWYTTCQKTMKVDENERKPLEVEVDVTTCSSTPQFDTGSEYSSRPPRFSIFKRSTAGNELQKNVSGSRKRQLEAELREPMFVKGDRGATMWVSWPYPVNEMRSFSSSMEDSAGDASPIESFIGASSSSSSRKRSRREEMLSEASVSHCGRDCSAYVCFCGRGT